MSGDPVAGGGAGVPGADGVGQCPRGAGVDGGDGGGVGGVGGGPSDGEGCGDGAGCGVGGGSLGGTFGTHGGWAAGDAVVVDGVSAVAGFGLGRPGPTAKNSGTMWVIDRVVVRHHDQIPLRHIHPTPQPRRRRLPVSHTYANSARPSRSASPAIVCPARPSPADGSRSLPPATRPACRSTAASSARAPGCPSASPAPHTRPAPRPCGTPGPPPPLRPRSPIRPGPGSPGFAARYRPRVAVPPVSAG